MRDRLRRLIAAAERRYPRLGARVLSPASVVSSRVHDDQLGIQAGSLTYGAFLAIPPMLILAVSAVTLVASNDAAAQQRLIESITALIPGLDQVLADQFSVGTAQQLGIGAIGVVALLWAASSFSSRTRTALGVVFRTGLPDLLTGRISGTLIGIPCFAGFVILAVLVQWSLGTDVPAWLSLLPGLVVLIVGAIFFLLIYWALTPPGPHHPALREHIPGAVACVIGAAFVERIGGAYVAYVIGHTTALYGTIGTIFGLLAFLYMMMWVFLLGAEISEALRLTDKR